MAVEAPNQPGSLHILFTTFAVCCLVSVSPRANASSYQLTLCDNCTSDQYGQAAVNVGCPNEDDVYVINRTANTTEFFTTICSYDPDYTIERAWQSSGDPGVLDQIDSAVSGYLALNVTANVQSGELPIPQGAGVNSAFDLVGDGGSYNQQIINNALNEYAVDDIWGLVINVSSTILSKVFDNFTSGFRVYFPDGTSYLFRATGIVQTPDGTELLYNHVAGSGLDGQGLPIPESPGGLLEHGTVDGTTTYVGNYRDLADDLGFLIHNQCDTEVEQLGCSDVGGHYQCTYRSHLEC